jgi:hypothetical protein
MISIQALTALAIVTACMILTPRTNGGVASDGGFTNSFVGAIAFGVHPGGDACATNGFARGAWRQKYVRIRAGSEEERKAITILK